MEYSRRQTTHPTLIGVAGPLLLATRPKQWTKNLIIFSALLFTINEAWDIHDVDRLATLFAKSAMAFVLFSALSGAIYLVNDIFDVDRDRLHPVKRYRPIASGRLPTGVAWTAAAILAATALALSIVLEPLFALVSASYLGIMVAYTLVLKRIILLDVFSISAGFVLRAAAGAAVLQVPISPWLYICTGSGALFIALAKRRSELALAGDEAGKQRESLERYTPAFLDQLILVIAPSTLIAYILYTFTAPNLPDNRAMMLTVPFVAYGLFRYMYLVHYEKRGENPEDILLSDAPLIACIFLWLATAASILVVFR